MIEINVYCDHPGCDLTVTAYPVKPSDVALPGTYLADQGWSCDERGAFCSDHEPVAAS